MIKSISEFKIEGLIGMRRAEIILIIIGLLAILPLSTRADEKKDARKTEPFSAVWKFGKDGNIELILRNTSGKDLLIVAPLDFVFDGSITYLDSPPPNAHMATTAIRRRNRDVMIPLFSRDDATFGREKNVVVGSMELGEETPKTSKITEVTYQVQYCFLSDIKHVNSFAQITKILRKWEGDAKEDQKAKVRLP